MLKVDKNHKRIDLREIDLKRAKELGLQIGAATLTLFMLSGCGKKKLEDNVKKNDVIPTTSQEIAIDEVEETVVKEYNIEEHNPDELVGSFSRGVEFKFADGRDVNLNELTYEDLRHVVECSLVVDDDEKNNYDYLNYMPNLKSLKILDIGSTKARLDNIDGSRFPSDISIEFYCSDNAEFSEEKFGFLKDVQNIHTLGISFTSNVDSSFIQSLKQVHNLKFNVARFSNFTYTDMTYLDSLELIGGTYDIVTCFSTDTIKGLEEHGVKVTADSLAEIKEVDKQIDDIVASLNIDDNATDQEKLNAVLTYVLTEFTYDPEVASSQGVEHESLSSSFYKNGSLDAAMTNETQICGNYAAMTSTLLKRLGVEAFNLNSKTHSWNAVKIGDYYYFVDACWLDNDYATECFANNNTSEIGNFSWYLIDPTELDAIEKSHNATFIPHGLDIKDIPENVENEVKYKEVIQNLDEDKVRDITGKKFEVTVGGKIITIGASAFVGVLAALGVGKLIKSKKERERIFASSKPLDDPYGRRY